jgi:hypothetical protein
MTPRQQPGNQPRWVRLNWAQPLTTYIERATLICQSERSVIEAIYLHVCLGLSVAQRIVCTRHCSRRVLMDQGATKLVTVAQWLGIEIDTGGCCTPLPVVTYRNHANKPSRSRFR